MNRSEILSVIREQLAVAAPDVPGRRRPRRPLRPRPGGRLARRARVRRSPGVPLRPRRPGRRVAGPHLDRRRRRLPRDRPGRGAVSRSVPVVVTGTGAVSALGGDVERDVARHRRRAERGAALVRPRRGGPRARRGLPGRRRAVGRRRARRAGARTGAGPAGGPRGARGCRPARSRRPPGCRGSDPARVGVFVGTTMGESGVYEEAGAAEEFDLAEGGSQVFAASVAAEFGVTGPCRTLGTACAAGNYAIGAAARAVASGPGRHRGRRRGGALLAHRDGRLRPDAGDGTRRLRAVRPRSARDDAR